MIHGSFEFELDIGNLIKAFSFLELEVILLIFFDISKPKFFPKVENVKVLSIDSPHFDIYEVFSIVNRRFKPEISLNDIVAFLKLKFPEFY